MNDELKMGSTKGPRARHGGSGPPHCKTLREFWRIEERLAQELRSKTTMPLFTTKPAGAGAGLTCAIPCFAPIWEGESKAETLFSKAPNNPKPKAAVTLTTFPASVDYSPRLRAARG
jgi:hypothetical protein